MRREGNIVEEITEYANLSEAFDQVLRGTKRKRSRQGRWLLEHREEVIASLRRRIGDGSFRVGGYREREIHEYGKTRHLQILSMEDRMAVNAIMTVVDRHLEKRYIRTTGASIRRRGTHDLMAYIRDDIRKDPKGTRYAYKYDIRHFYENVNQEVAMRCFRRVFKDDKLLAMLESFTTMLDSGISFGLRSSQGTGNLLLSMCLDHELKDRCGVSHYYRYCDDGLVLAGTKEELWAIRDIVHERLEAIGLEVKPDERVFPVTEGIDFLGYVIYPDHVAIRKRIKKKTARKLHEVKSRKRRRELVASFYGMSKHADCITLFNKLTGKDMKSFKELNVSYKPSDGKKRFAGAIISIRELVNLPIVVKDFETGIKTEQGENRCLVSIELNGEPRKFFTNSEEMKNILAQVAELPDGFPFETTIKTEAFGKGKTKYIFS